MDILSYATQNGGTGTLTCPILRELARRIGCAKGTLYMIATGHKRAGPKMARAIEQATEGAVTRQDLRPDIFGDLPTEREVHRDAA